MSNSNTNSDCEADDEYDNDVQGLPNSSRKQVCSVSFVIHFF